jgi:hypothetical protein
METPMHLKKTIQGSIPRVIDSVLRVCSIPPQRRIAVGGFKGHHTSFNREDGLALLGAFAFLILFASPTVASYLSLPPPPIFTLQVEDGYYLPENGVFKVSGTLGTPVPSDYTYTLIFVAIKEGTKTIRVRDYKHGMWYIPFGGRREGPEWTFILLNGIQLASQSVQLTFEYRIGHWRGETWTQLEQGTAMFSMTVA